MKLIITAFLILAACSACSEKREPNWAEIARRVEAYTKDSSPGNAKSAIAVLPKEQVSFSGSPEESDANKKIYAGKPMTILEQQVLKRDQKSVEMAFRLLNIADGAFAEDLDIILGKLIRVDPVLFLSELQRANSSGLEQVVLNAGDMGEMEKTCIEWRLRKEALQTVQVPSLERIKQRAIGVINEESSSCGTQQAAPPDASKPTASERR